ncbi:hypothetical protein [Scytonema sp. NUACC21]
MLLIQVVMLAPDKILEDRKVVLLGLVVKTPVWQGIQEEYKVL